ncbi:hypothetical protein NST58_01745 [Paenibacillus sp. FSL R10-2796]|uniref:hypothetical protein n=1 Tax=Paenibacillus sp. FSL R10-2796 TaxID=2954663 RepID=UPI0030DCDB8D
MNKISRKTVEVADLPRRYPMNLQLFSEDGTPSLEDSPEYQSDMNEFDSKMQRFMSERESPTNDEPTETVEDSEQAETPEVAEPEDKPKQDSETNKAFQEMRKQLDAEKARAAEVEARAKKADELIAKQYGESHGIYTVEQYEQRLQEEEERANIERYEGAGLTPEEIQMLKEYPQLKQSSTAEQEARRSQELEQGWVELFEKFPDLGKAVEDQNQEAVNLFYNDKMKKEMERGASPLAAYLSANFDAVLESRLKNVQEAAKQEALDKLNSKEHLAPNASTGGEVDHVEIDDETMRAYRALNKGKSDAQIRAWHKKHAK